MIERHWKAIVKTEEADNYISYLLSDTFPALGSLDGFIKASILTKTFEGGIEFLVVTVWNSIEAIMQFAGDEVDTAVVPQIVQPMMLVFDRKVTHFKIEVEYNMPPGL